VTGPVGIQRWLDENLHRFDLPAQMLGDEPNAVRKPWDSATVRWCLVASWPYEQAAGNSSIPAVYKTINDASPDYLADRFYLPATPRDLRLLERAKIPIFGIESKQPLAAFDVVGTSISYPVLTLSWIKMLAMSGIPARWRDRDPNAHPMVIAGGLSYGAPEVLAPVVDAWFCGEVEDEPGNPGLGDVCARINRFKAAGRWSDDRIGCYEALAREFNFLYFPRFVQVHYGYEDRSHVGVGPRPSKQVIGYTSTLEGMRLPFTKRHVRNLDNVPPLDNPPLLYADPSQGAGDLEVGRGCPAWCSFCALTYRQKPYRQRSVEKTVSYAQSMQRNMGSVRLTPFSPDFPMHTQRRSVVAALLEQVSDEVDASTMRVDDFIADPGFILLQVAGGMDTVTLGVEGISQRMRDLVGKGTSDADIKEAVTRGIRAGVRKFKLYMISGLPGEDEGDTFRILRLAKELADIRESMGQPNVQIQFSWTPLLIEGNTPMQWFAPTSQNRLLAEILDELRDLGVKGKLGAKGEENKAAFFQLCQRASRDVGEALVDAMLEVDQACWGGVPRTFKALLEERLRHWGFHNGLADCFDERFRDDMFGWEFVDQGISAELMWRAYLQMREFAEQTDSHTYDSNFGPAYHGNEWIPRCDTNCQGKACGACNHEDLRIRTGYIRAAQQERDIDLPSLQPVDQRSQVVRIRAHLHKPEQYRYVGNDHWRFALRRASFRAAAELPDIPGGIAKRSIRFASDLIRYRDWTAGADYVEFALTRPTDEAAIGRHLDAMRRHLAQWVTVGEYQIRPQSARALSVETDTQFFELEVDADPETVVTRLQLWHDTDTIMMRLPVAGSYFAPTAEDANAKDHVRAIWLVRDGYRLKLRMLIHGRPSPYHIYAALMGRASWLDAARYTAWRLDIFMPAAHQELLHPTCHSCGTTLPLNLLDRLHHPEHCPRCLDIRTGALIETAAVS
jgi:hypothetical protein